ncbi:MAG: ribonuclease III [Dissulfurimicrobium sp.]|uniref:ribonuclease III n=1 Tax=Dissulfurimicrobium sp. TaxID=2022436 RepID=UPI00404A2BE0
MQRKDHIQEFEKRIDYCFLNKRLLTQAFTHRSYAVEQRPMAPDNERLEFLGDAVLDLIISHLLFFRYGSEYREGDLSRMKAFLVNESQLAKQASLLGFADFLLLGKGEAKDGGYNKSSILADAFEALIGAIYLDGGIEPAFSFVKKCFEELLDKAFSLGMEQDYKTNLQEISQRLYHDIPVYKVEDVSGPDHARVFTVSLYLRGNMLARGRGRSKKEAEQEAARITLETLFEKKK